MSGIFFKEKSFWSINGLIPEGCYDKHGGLNAR